MGRYTEAVCRLCRRHGGKLFLKGTRCQTDKCAVSRRPFSPGQHGKVRKKESDYGIQVAEKQKLKRMYGLLERQFRNYFRKASKAKGVTGSLLLQYLERRLDNVVFRLSFAASRSSARQLVRHSLFKVNGKNVNIPSYLVRGGDTIELKPKEKNQKIVKETLELLKDRPVPKWIKRDGEHFKGMILSLPERDDIEYTVDENMIVELYSK
ncbi:MAG: 30S ribosomal protein S4 [Candidatus Omnitrophica bacterium]|nr:30S ribosomal protein S4 [Candidatus Omnitrophota bacterium]